MTQPSLPPQTPRQSALQRLIFAPLGYCVTLATLLSSCAATPPKAAESPAPSPAPALEITNDDIINYSKAVLAIEPYRQTALDQVRKSAGTENPPNFTCNQSETLKPLSKAVQKIAVEYCTQAKELSDIHGLPVETFNAISFKAQTDPTLKQQIQSELIRQQQNSLTQPSPQSATPTTLPASTANTPLASPQNSTAPTQP